VKFDHLRRITKYDDDDDDMIVVISIIITHISRHGYKHEKIGMYVLQAKIWKYLL